MGTQESGLGTVPRADTSGYIACGIAGCTTVDNPNAASRNVDWIHITGMYLQANGASSKVLNLTSIGHADIENNRFVLGTGGNSYGIFGDTSTGDLDSTNSLIKHNEFDPESTGDTCASLAGVFNVVVLEQNSCYLAPGAGQGFALAKDSNGNYPNNDEFYGNDCETASTAFNQICYNIVGAQSVVIGPNNRCENVYNCFQFPADGSAVGIHLLDPYISLSSHTVVKPNEPSTAMVAVDNNGHNWLPSMHFGLNDDAGPNLLNNSAFEGWGSSTSLYYWGGVSGTNINQAGSGIYAQNASSGSPTADPFTQGTYNVVIGDNATAGLGINSGCIQVDATMNYTLAFRIAAASTGIAFRPGFRFYSDANCTEANRITSASSNARVLTPANYAGDSNTAINGANWQSTNASLTYNNGITCNCNVTGADWNVATANLWTATPQLRNHVSRAERLHQLGNDHALDARLHPRKHGGKSKQNLRGRYRAEPGLGEHQSSAAGRLQQHESDGVRQPQCCGKPHGGHTACGADNRNADGRELRVVRFDHDQCAGRRLAMPGAIHEICDGICYRWAGAELDERHRYIGDLSAEHSVLAHHRGRLDHRFQHQRLLQLGDHGHVRQREMLRCGGKHHGGRRKRPIVHAGNRDARERRVHFRVHRELDNGENRVQRHRAACAYRAPSQVPRSSSGAMTFPIAIPSAGVTYSGYGMPAIILH